MPAPDDRLGIALTPATAAMLPAIEQLLAENHLPLDGVRDCLANAIVAILDEAIVGCAALELHPDGALLRSVAVASSCRGRGLGIALTRAALDVAAHKHMPAAYLLTTTAAEFFPRLGFESIARADVPAGVQASVEFAYACPASAVVMRKLFAPSHAGH